MKKEAFIEHMDRLISVFGETHYPEARVKLIYQEVNDLSDRDWKKLVDNLIGTFHVKYPPLLPDFREGANKIRASHFKDEVRQAGKAFRKLENGLADFLKSMDADSLVDAVKKSRP